MEYLSDDISELTSDSEIRREIAECILLYMDDLETYSFSSIKSMTIDQRDEFRNVVEPLVEEYLSGEYFIDDQVVTIAQQHERERIRKERVLERGDFLTREPISSEEVLKNDQFFRTYFCEDCGEKVQGLFNLDDHMGLNHFEKYVKRYVCEICTGMWLMRHVH